LKRESDLSNVLFSVRWFQRALKELGSNKYATVTASPRTTEKPNE
jgi:hypothetical protein